MGVIKTAIKNVFYYIHRFCLYFGVIILPKHYYVPFSDTNELRKMPQTWAVRSSMTGVPFDLDQQIRNLEKIVGPYEEEYRGNRHYKFAVTNKFGLGYGYVEAQALHGFIRYFAPKNVIEVGSGVSTYCMLKALEYDSNRAELTCIEPYPSSWLESADVRLIREKVENVDLKIFESLSHGDFLFIDSSHTVKIAGDVNRIILEIFPRLSPGVIIHIHDIFLPYDYQRNADRTMMPWLETAMLHAFLINNEKMEIIACLSHLHYDKKYDLRKIFPEYASQVDRNGLLENEYTFSTKIEEHFPSSIYLRVLGQ